MAKPIKRDRSAISGRFVKTGTAKKRPKTNTSDVMKRRKKC